MTKPTLRIHDDADTWYLDSHKLAVLLDSLLAECSSVDECREVVDHVLDKPWKFRPEYVCAACRLRDRRAG